MTTYTLYQTDEDGGKHYKVDGSTKKIVTENDEGFKEWLAEGNTPDQTVYKLTNRT